MPGNDRSPLASVLASVLAACPDGDDVREILKGAGKTAAIKQAFAPFKKGLEGGQSPQSLLQQCLELPADAPLHAAAAELLAGGAVAGPVHVSLAGSPQPRRMVVTLLRSRVAPIVYAAETKGCVSLWSTETGEHVADLSLGKKSVMALGLAELADGGLRVRTSTNEVLLRKPGAAGFERLVTFKVEGGAKRENCWVGSDDLRYHLVKPDYNLVDGPEGPRFRLHLYDVEGKAPSELAVAGYADDFIKLGPARVGVPYTRDADDGTVHELAIVDLATAEVRVLPLPRDASSFHAVDGGAALVLAGEVDGKRGWARVRLADGEVTAIAAEQIDPRRQFPRELVPLYDGYKDGMLYTDGEIRDLSGAVLAYYSEGPANFHGRGERTLLLRGPQPGSFILGSGDEDGTVTVIVPYGSAGAAAPRAAAPLPEAPAWARAGTLLRYDSADFDAADGYRYRVLAADDGLTVQIDMVTGVDEEDGEPERVGVLRFTDAALQSATQPVVVTQGSTDLDDAGAPVRDRSPPCMLGRELFARLVGGAEVAFTHPWNGEPAPLRAAGEPQPRMLKIDGKDMAVPVRVFEGEAGTLVVLDLPSWPLIVSYETGDCHLRLGDVTLGGATSEPATAAVRRFEVQEDDSGKFWEVAVEGAELRVRYGKLGTQGRTTTKTLESSAAATREADKLVREKTKKGYQAVA